MISNIKVTSCALLYDGKIDEKQKKQCLHASISQKIYINMFFAVMMTVIFIDI